MTYDARLAAYFSRLAWRQRAIVIGGGVAGQLVARVLINHFDQVLLLERDRYPDEAELRPGIPQAKHTHLLLLRGKQILEQLFPGLTTDLIEQGAQTVEMGRELAALTYYGWRVRYPGGLTLLTFTRALLDRYLRHRLAKTTGISLVDGCQVTGLLTNEELSRIIGVRCQFSEDSHREEILYGDLIIDASGRFSRTPDWLSALGYDRPVESVVDSHLGYASRLYAVPQENASPGSDWRALLLLGKPPNHTRGGVLLPVEGNRWHVTLVGIGRDYPPVEEKAFLEFASTLRSPILYDAIRVARPQSEISGYQATENRRRYYESFQNWPEGFIVLGDAACAFNPIYAQGISVSAMEVLALDQWLRDHLSPSGVVRGMARSFQQRLKHVIEVPWLMATSEDLRWPATEGGHSSLWMRLIRRYLDAVIVLATQYPGVDRAYAEVAHLVEPPRRLFHPSILIRVAAHLINPFSTTIQGRSGLSGASRPASSDGR